MEPEGERPRFDRRTSGARRRDNASAAGDVGGARSVAHLPNHAHYGAGVHGSGGPVGRVFQGVAEGGDVTRAAGRDCFGSLRNSQYQSRELPALGAAKRRAIGFDGFGTLNQISAPLQPLLGAELLPKLAAPGFSSVIASHAP